MGLGPLALAAALLAGCGGQSGDPGTPGTEAPRAEAPQEPGGLDQRPGNTSCLAGPPPPTLTAVATVPAFPSLPAFDQPVAMIQPPNDPGHWYLVERAGRIKRFAATASATGVRTVLDIGARVDSGPPEAGLLGLAFHPDFGHRGADHGDEVFLSYTAPGNPLQSRVSRFLSRDGIDIDPASETVLLRLEQDFGNHNGGHIAFDRDGYLVVGFGDGGSGGDPNNRAQTTANLFGSLLRIDVDGDLPYAIPADNPFAGNPLCDTDGFSPTGADCPETFAWGLRNPWRWSVDPATHQLWLGDVGQNAWEEIDRVARGGNYGWRLREGAHCFDPPSGCPSAGLIDPVAEYSHREGSSVTGGYVYRGRDLPALAGVYLYGDFGNGRLLGLFGDGLGGYAPRLLADTPFNISSFAQDGTGEVYLLDYFAGRVHRITATGNGGDGGRVPERLSATGCVDPVDATAPAAGLIPYRVRATSWSDGAVKRHWLALPDTATVAVPADGDWQFPVGSVLMQRLERDGAPVETRLLMRHDDGAWAGYAYAWNPAGTDATLVRGGRLARLPGGDHVIPSGEDCMRCHNAAAGFVLGLETARLNDAILYPATGRIANQLATLNAIGLLSPPLSGAPSSQPSLADPFDLGADLDARARAYLHVNCAQCHRPGGPTPSSMDLRHATTLAGTATCEVSPSRGDLGTTGARLIAPGQPAASILLARLQRRDALAMPPLATSLVDAGGARLLGEWVSALAACP